MRETDTVARLGGDEFAIIQSEVGRHQDANILAERVLHDIAQPFELDGHQVFVAASMGIAVAPNDGTEVEQLLKNADLALYQAKIDGRNRSRFFETEMNVIVQHRRTLELALRQALSAGQFELHYQPIIELESNEIMTFEALLRWHHPERGLLLPAEFVPLAEEIGLILPLGEWALRQACAQAAAWPHAVKVAVNLSPAHFRTGNIVNVVMNALASSGLSPDRLELEITEIGAPAGGAAKSRHAAQSARHGSRHRARRFRHGVCILELLADLPVRPASRSTSLSSAPWASARAAPQSFMRLSDWDASLGMGTTAEGVETNAQLDELRAIGCSQAQGNLFSPPRPFNEFAHLLAQAKPIAKRAPGSSLRSEQCEIRSPGEACAGAAPALRRDAGRGCG